MAEKELSGGPGLQDWGSAPCVKGGGKGGSRQASGFLGFAIRLSLGADKPQGKVSHMFAGKMGVREV